MIPFDAADRWAERYMQGTPEEREQIAKEIHKLPAPPAARIAVWVGMITMISLLATIDYLLLVKLSYMQTDKKVILIFNLVAIAGIAKTPITYHCLCKPSVYGLLERYKTRHGALPERHDS